MQLDGKRGRRSELDATFLVLVGIAWASGLVYLVVRANLPSPVRLVIVDGLHVYVGLASIVFVIALLATQAPLRAFQTGRALRQLRWLLGGLYLVLFGAGALLALPWSAPVRTFFVDLHLLAAVWSVVPTGWYLVHDRSATLRSSMTSRSVVALVLILAPAALVVVIAPRMIAPLTLTGAGAAWREQGLPQRFIDRMATSPNGQDLVAGGEGLYVRRPSDQRWQQVAFPSELVLSVALSPIAAYVGTTHGVYASEQVGGPYRKLPLPSFEVHGIAVDSQDPNVIWVSSRGGFWLSANGGHDWSPESAGIQDPTAAWAIAYFRGSLFASDSEAVYRWNGARWLSSSDQRYVVSLDPSADRARLFAGSMGQGIRSFDGRTWTKSDAGLSCVRGHNARRRRGQHGRRPQLVTAARWTAARLSLACAGSRSYPACRNEQWHLRLPARSVASSGRSLVARDCRREPGLGVSRQLAAPSAAGKTVLSRRRDDGGARKRARRPSAQTPSS